jgi:hypothetical protein
VRRKKRVRVEDLVLGMYVAEPDGIWTPIGTVTTERVAKRRRVVSEHQPRYRVRYIPLACNGDRAERRYRVMYQVAADVPHVAGAQWREVPDILGTHGSYGYWPDYEYQWVYEAGEVWWQTNDESWRPAGWVGDELSPFIWRGPNGVLVQCC